MIDAGWVRPEIVVNEADLWQLPTLEAQELDAFVRTGFAPGVEVWRSDVFGGTQIRVRDRRPCVTEIPSRQRERTDA